MDDLAEQLDIDPLELRAAQRAPGGLADRDVAGAASRAPACPPASSALRPRWSAMRGGARPAGNEAADGSRVRRGVGVAAMWYGIGNTSLPNPSEIEVGMRADGTVVLFSGATDIGQGSNTILAQIAADALGERRVADAVPHGPDPDARGGPGRRRRPR